MQELNEEQSNENEIIYKPPDSFYFYSKLLLASLFINGVLVILKFFLCLQPEWAIQDLISVMLIGIAYYQKNYLICLLTIFYFLYLLFGLVYFFGSLTQYHIELLKDSYPLKLKMMNIMAVNQFVQYFIQIVSSGVYVLSCIIIQKAYREYKGLIFDIRQQNDQRIQQEQRNEMRNALQDQQEYLNQLQLNQQQNELNQNQQQPAQVIPPQLQEQLQQSQIINQGQDLNQRSQSSQIIPQQQGFQPFSGQGLQLG